MSRGDDALVELLLGQVAEGERGLLQRRALVVRLLGDLRRLVVADVGLRAVTSISDRSHVLRRSAPGSARGPRRRTRGSPAGVGEQVARECRKLWIITGLNTFSSKLPCEPANADRGVVAEDLARRPSSCASDCVGFTLPGMIDEPGSFSGRRSSPSPARGRDAEPADVVGDLHERARPASAARRCANDERVVRRQRRELVRRAARTAAR